MALRFLIARAGRPFDLSSPPLRHPGLTPALVQLGHEDLRAWAVEVEDKQGMSALYHALDPRSPRTHAVTLHNLRLGGGGRSTDEMVLLAFTPEYAGIVMELSWVVGRADGSRL
jgi:hypothetical protein